MRQTVSDYYSKEQYVSEVSVRGLTTSKWQQDSLTPHKSRDLHLNSSLCRWILNFLTSGGVWEHPHLILSHPQHWLPGVEDESRAVLYTVDTHDSSTTVEFADDTAMVGIIYSDMRAYLDGGLLLYNIRIHPFLTTEAVQVLVITSLDYWNSLFAGPPVSTSDLCS